MDASSNGSEALVACYRTLNWPNQSETVIRLRGLDAKADTGVSFFGDELMYSGLPIGYFEWCTSGDFA